MLENLLKHLQEEISPKIEESAQLNPEQAKEATGISHSMIADTIKNHIADGHSSSLLGLLGSDGADTASHPFVSTLKNNVASELSNRMELGSSQAHGIGSTVVQSTMNFLRTNFSQSNHEKNANGLAEFLHLRNDGGFMDKIKGMADKLGLGGLFGGK